MESEHHNQLQSIKMIAHLRKHVIIFPPLFSTQWAENNPTVNCSWKTNWPSIRCPETKELALPFGMLMVKWSIRLDLRLKSHSWHISPQRDDHFWFHRIIYWYLNMNRLSIWLPHSCLIQDKAWEEGDKISLMQLNEDDWDYNFKWCLCCRQIFFPRGNPFVLHSEVFGPS